MTKKELTALVVDDEEKIRNLLVEMLSTVSHLRIETASNGEEAYRRIKAKKPDILYTDIIMPNMHGYELLERLVNDGVKIPTFVISATTLDQNAATTFFHSHRMYTEEQARELKLPVKDTTAEVMRYIDEQICNKLIKTYRMRELLRSRGKDDDKAGVPYNFGFNVLTKPFNIKELLRKTERLQRMLYRKGNPYTTT